MLLCRHGVLLGPGHAPCKAEAGKSAIEAYNVVAELLENHQEDLVQLAFAASQEGASQPVLATATSLGLAAACCGPRQCQDAAA